MFSAFHMEVKAIADKLNWDNWLKNNSQCHKFAQSWEWGDILLSEQKVVDRLAVLVAGDILAQAQVIYSNLPFGWKYGFCPKGPVFNRNLSFGDYNEVCGQLLKYLAKKNCIFFRIETDQQIACSQQQKTIDINPRATLILDLSRAENELFDDMRSKTRYNIRLAQGKGLQVSDIKDLEKFYQLSQKTAKRDRFSLHPKIHYQRVLASTASLQLSVVHSGKLVASDVFVGFGNTFTYLYGALDYAARSLMAPYLLQWEGIKLAKQLGYKYYDMFGVAPMVNIQAIGGDFKNKQEHYEYDHKHQYASITRFKLGFGGEIREESGTFDLIINQKKYSMYSLLRKANGLFRKKL